jgi:nucleotide-binding universal stress UspA family protein
MRRILLATDFSDNANDALEYVLRLVENDKTEIQLLTVVRPVVVDISDATMVNARATELVIERSKQNLGELKATVVNHRNEFDLVNLTITTFVSVGSVANEIVRQADAFQADFIIIGARGESLTTIGRYLGTTSTKVVRSANCPVILIPHNYKYQKLDNLIFSSNLDTGDSFELHRALNLLSPHKPLVRVVHVKNPYDEENKSRLEAFSKYMLDHSSAIRTVFEIATSSDVVELINERALRYDAELIVMHRSKKRLLELLFKSSHTREMIFLASVPLMVLN